MKIALCLAGQYRTFNSEYVQKTLHKFILNKYNCDVYFSTWTNKGKSLAHTLPTEIKNDTIITEYDILKYIPNAKVEIENYNNWKESLNETYSILLQNTLNTIYSGSLPQLYKNYRVYELIPKNIKYDFIIITRPDIFFFGNLNIEDMLNIEAISNKNIIWNFNAENTWAYHPSRIYAILYMGAHINIEKMSTCYFYISQLFNDPYNSSLAYIDVCKMLYLYAKDFCNLEIKSTPSIIGNVYRNENDISYNLNNCKIEIEKFKKEL